MIRKKYLIITILITIFFTSSVKTLTILNYTDFEGSIKLQEVKSGFNTIEKSENLSQQLFIKPNSKISIEIVPSKILKFDASFQKKRKWVIGFLAYILNPISDEFDMTATIGKDDKSINSPTIDNNWALALIENETTGGITILALDPEAKEFYLKKFSPLTETSIKT